MKRMCLLLCSMLVCTLSFAENAQSHHHGDGHHHHDGPLLEHAINDTSLVNNYSLQKTNSGKSVESFLTTSGQPVQIVQHMCAHFDVVYRFPLKPFPKKNIHKISANLLNELVDITPEHTALLQKTLRNTPVYKLPAVIRMKNNQGSIYLRKEKRLSNEFLVVTYNQPL